MTTRNELIKEMELRLGGQMVDIELDPEHYQLAVDKAIERFRQRSDNAVFEEFIPLDLEVEVNLYKLDDDIVEVRDIYQRSTGVSGTASEFEPFEAQYMNSYLLQSGRAGGLATYDALAQHHETMGRLFGAEIQFTWNSSRKQIFLHRKVRADKTVFLHVYRLRTEEELFNDISVKPWVADYALAHAKMMIGEARSKFATIAGPQGGTTLNGDALKAEASADFERLDEDIKLYKDGGSPLGFIIG